MEGINEQTNTNMQLVYKFDINHSDRLCAICRVNADVNGALNIGRKVFGDSFMIADSGRWYRPERINVLKCVCENVH